MKELWAIRKAHQNNSSTTTTVETPKSAVKFGGKVVLVTNLGSQETEEFISMKAAMIRLAITRNTLRSYIKNGSTFTKVTIKDGTVIKEQFKIEFKADE